MKKLVLMLAVVFSASPFSCGSSDKAAAEATDTIVAAVEEVEAVVADTLSNDSVVTETVVAEAAAAVAE